MPKIRNVSRLMLASALVSCIPLGCSKPAETTKTLKAETEPMGRTLTSLVSGADNTDFIQKEIDERNYVFLPAGVYYVDASKGIRLRSGTRIEGEGKHVSLLVAKYKTSGSIFKREFNSGVKNEYVIDIKISNVGVVLNHQGLPKGEYQIAFDFRNITRSALVNVYAGNCNSYLPGENEPLPEAQLKMGYGVVFGNISSSSVAYAGGEVNQIRFSHICGAKRGIVIDDPSLSPASSAHATNVYRNLVEHAQIGIAQLSRYGSGVSIRANQLQKISRAPNSKTNSYALGLGGYGNTVADNHVVNSSPDVYMAFLSNAKGDTFRGNRAGPDVSMTISVAKGATKLNTSEVSRITTTSFRATETTFPDFRVSAINILDKGAVSGEDSTQAIQAAIDDPAGRVFIPAGRYLINPAIGLKLRNGVEIRGAGRLNSFLIAMPGAGSIIGRVFNSDPASTNDKIEGVAISDLAVVLSKTYTPSVAAQRQIAFDFRHIGKSTISDVFAGSYDWSDLDPAIPSGNYPRGYGFVFGGTITSQPNYANATGNTLLGARIWGTYKAVVIDDRELSGPSAAHSTLVYGSDVQLMASGITQECKSTYHTSIIDNTIQGFVGGRPEKIAYELSGVRGRVDGGYIEAPSMDVAVRLGENSKDNTVYPFKWSQGATLGNYAVFQDLGTNNTIRHYHPDDNSFGDGAHPEQ